LNCNVDGK